VAKGAHSLRIPPGDLLVVAPVRLDDACFSIPATRALAAHQHVRRLKILCDEDQAALWNTMPILKPISFPASARPKAIAEAVWEDGGEFTAALAWESGHAATALKPLGIRKNFGPAAAGRDFIPVDANRSRGPVQHRVQDFLSVAKALGARPFNAGCFAPVDLKLGPLAPSIALIPDSDFGSSHLWRGPCWSAVGSKLIERHRLRPTIIGPGPAAESLAAELGDSANFEQPETLAVRIELLARHRLVVACDGSSPHLASHVGATCVVLFGPNDPHWRRPLGTRHVPLHQHVECSPCLLPDCPLDHRCMKAIDSDMVLDTVGPLIRAAAG
jgi:heptosyltransferase-2